MKKGIIQVKENLSLSERERYILLVADAYFETNPDGTVTFTPYRTLEALMVGFFTFCVQGITYEEGETVYDCMKDRQLQKLFQENRFTWFLTEIDDCARDLADFRKEQLLAAASPVHRKLQEALEAELLVRRQEQELLKKQEEFLESQKKQNAYAEKVMALLTPEETAALNRKLLAGPEEMQAALQMLAGRAAAAAPQAEGEAERGIAFPG